MAVIVLCVGFQTNGKSCKCTHHHKVASGLVYTNNATPSFVNKKDEMCNLQCQSCAPLKREFQVLVSEIKSMSEIINILKEELNYHSTMPRVGPNITCSNKLANSSLYCGKCYELETQLTDTSNELSSVKLIIDILNEEIKALKQTPNNDAYTNRPWANARTRGPRGPAIVQLHKEVPTTHGIPTTDHYAIPVTNRYDALSNRHESSEPSDTLFP